MEEIEVIGTPVPIEGGATTAGGRGAGHLRVIRSDPAPDGVRLTSRARAGELAWSEERLLVPRALTAVALLAFLATYQSTYRLAAGGIIAALACASAYSALCLRLPDAAEERRLAAASPWLTGVDAACAIGTCAALLHTTEPISTLLIPLVAFELTLKHGRRGTLAALLLVVMATAALALGREIAGVPHPFNVFSVLIVGSAAAASSLATALRGEWMEHQRAERARERIATAMRTTLAEVLRSVGAADDGEDAGDLSALIEAACRRPELAPELGRRLAAVVGPPAVTRNLTRREREVLQHLADGASDRDIARKLFVEVGTIRVHVSNVVRKLGVADRDEAVALVRGHRPT